ncbi:osmoprotectant transport system ATP-binding protein [Pasteurella testudinis DSM 23072]|uniref:Osmoprotectant transport system ATP-binding protein n=1 Tax=Pasteurella testudinis DSM 23072 TaxID=1122938 RepID=A0A1W1V8U2_9PAST|nr:ABC transporter ATP-binding protein [Pasteurella testudinis]SMB89782.1 osmoprotectant transport system ATP-binding protein [Pasteurella testudinis DSM 23072]SUB52086.1 putrescine/spermidine ABC transporter ATPase [Pasteurella testudinis]
MIRLSNVSKIFANQTALYPLDLQIEQGDFITIIGQSGSGKTTLLKLLNGLLKPDSGQISVLGTALATADLVQLRRKIGYVVQENGLFPHLTVAENIGYVPGLQKIPKSEINKRVMELLPQVNLDEELKNRYPHQLSGGQKQRVGIARALAAKPDIILMDEPFSALDPVTRKLLQQEIKQLWQTLGTTIVFVTHDIDEALTLGSKVLVLHRGKIEQFAPPQQVQTAPASDLVRLLLGTVIDRQTT